MTTIEMTVSDRISALDCGEINDARRLLLAKAIALGADDAALTVLGKALRASVKTTILIPNHSLATLSRGRGWCRKGKGDSATWGERDEDGLGYRVGPGKWIVGGHDGFSRKRQEEWKVEHVTVGDETWTVAS